MHLSFPSFSAVAAGGILAGVLIVGSGCESPTGSASGTVAANDNASVVSATPVPSPAPSSAPAKRDSATAPTATPSPFLRTASAGTTASPPTTATSKSTRSNDWQLVRWVSAAGVARDTRLITYDSLMNGKLSPEQLISASRLNNSAASLSMSYHESDLHAVRSAIELEAAYFPDLMRNKKFVREGNRMVVTGPGMLRFEFVRGDAAVASSP